MKIYKLSATLILSGLISMAAAQTNNTYGGNTAPGGSASAGAQENSGMGSGAPHRPPPQAIEACSNKASGASCSFVGREDKTLSGTCFAPPEGNHPLACRPVHGPK